MGRTKQSNGTPSDTGNADGGSNGADISASAPIFASGTVLIDPASIGEPGSGSNGSGSGDITGEPVRKRRGRKPGSRNASKAPPLDINGLEKILLSAHAMLAGIAAPQLRIDDEEAHQLATGISNVARHYDVGATEKTLDWCNLFMALGVVYGPRFIAISVERRSAAAKKKEAKQNAPDLSMDANGFAPQFRTPPFTGVPQ